MEDREQYREREQYNDRDDRGGKDDGEKGGRRSFHRKKVCKFCADTEYVLDYKDARMMQSYMMELGKVVPRRISGTCAFHQRKLTSAIKRARNLALVGFTNSGPQQEYTGGHGGHERGGYGDRDRGHGGGYDRGGDRGDRGHYGR